MNELVKRLSRKQSIEASRSTKTVEELKESIDRDYVHILFKKTGTELGMQLDRGNCSLDSGDFDKAEGEVRLVGGLTLNYDKVRCVAEIDLKTLKGKGRLESVDDDEYKKIMATEGN